VSEPARSRRRPRADKTVRDIAQHAGANLAAIGYHFGDKLGLYTEIVEGAIVAMREMTDANLNATVDLTPADQMRRYITAFVTRAAQSSGKRALMQQLMRHEMLDPTPLAQRVVDEGILPRLRILSQIVARMLDCPLTDARVRPCVMCVQALCLSFVRERLRNIVIDDWPAPDEAGLLRDAALVAEFAVAGIHGMVAPPAQPKQSRQRERARRRT
jgi:AcrR family transcriptional regulator